VWRRRRAWDIIGSKSIFRYQTHTALIFDKADCLALSESLVEGQHEENFLFIDVGAIFGIRQLRGTASHGDDDNDHAGSNNNGSST
jgi:hypothetical protein